MQMRFGSNWPYCNTPAHAPVPAEQRYGHPENCSTLPHNAEDGRIWSGLNWQHKLIADLPSADSRQCMLIHQWRRRRKLALRIDGPVHWVVQLRYRPGHAGGFAVPLAEGRLHA